MGTIQEPDCSLATNVLPPALYRALVHLFAQGIDGVQLVGGTALAGYYAAHRRSDDLDLFTKDAHAQQATVLAVNSLEDLGCVVLSERSSAQFHSVTCRLDDHHFTAQIVLDPRLFEIDPGLVADDRVVVASLISLLKMKAATLVSRASEKDLYDLAWLFEQHDHLDLSALIDLGKEVDGGVNAEAILMNLAGTPLRESACNFSLTKSSTEVFAELTRLQESLIQSFEAHLRGQPPSPLGQLVRRLRK